MNQYEISINVLPRLKPGVLIHFHDILYPFVYPEAWFREGRAWNEVYLIRAFLQNNPDYEILLFGCLVAAESPLTDINDRHLDMPLPCPTHGD